MQVAYYNEYIRCYLNGKIETRHALNGKLLKDNKWREVHSKPDVGDGYVRIRVDGKREKWHKVIWVAFNGDIPDGLEINHKDMIRHHNSLDNLELMTHGDNVRYSQSKAIVGININTGDKVEFSSMAEAGENGFNKGNICSCIKGRLEQHKGYKWYYSKKE